METFRYISFIKTLSKPPDLIFRTGYDILSYRSLSQIQGTGSFHLFGVFFNMIISLIKLIQIRIIQVNFLSFFL